LILSNDGILDAKFNDIPIKFPEDENSPLKNGRNQLRTRKQPVYQEYRTKILRNLDSAAFEKNMS
jgi:hypothetical protein